MKNFSIHAFLHFLHMSKARAYTFLLRREFGSFGRSSIILPPFKSGNLQQLHIGNHCRIAEQCWIVCVEKYAGVQFHSRLQIGNGTSIGRFSHIVACGEMRIGNDVAIAERVYISDNIHGYENINQDIMAQPLKHKGPVIIEDEVWIGDGACILPDVTIGRHSIIGSNAVVTHDIPPYSVAAGVPAKVISRYNPATETWEKVGNKKEATLHATISPSPAP